MNAIHLLPQTFCPPTRAIPFIIKFEYKRDHIGNVIGRKARFALRGDLLVAHIDFNPSEMSALMDSKSAGRFLVALAAYEGLPLEHFDLKSAYIECDFKFSMPFYVKEPIRADSKYPHGKTVGIL